MIELPNPWNDLDSASGLSVADTAVASNPSPHVPEAAAGNVIDLLNAAWLAGVEASFNSVSDDDAGSSLPSEMEPFVGLLAASSEFSSCDGSHHLPGPSVDSSNGRYDPLDREVEGATSESGPQETPSESARIPARGHLAAGVESLPTPAVFSFELAAGDLAHGGPRQASEPGSPCAWSSGQERPSISPSIPESADRPDPQIMSAGDTGATSILGVSSPVGDFVRKSMPISELQNRGFDPERFLNDIDPPPLFLSSKPLADTATPEDEALLRSLIGGAM